MFKVNFESEIFWSDCVSGIKIQKLRLESSNRILLVEHLSFIDHFSYDPKNVWKFDICSMLLD